MATEIRIRLGAVMDLPGCYDISWNPEKLTVSIFFREGPFLADTQLDQNFRAVLGPDAAATLQFHLEEKALQYAARALIGNLTHVREAE